MTWAYRQSSGRLPLVSSEGGRWPKNQEQIEQAKKTGQIKEQIEHIEQIAMQNQIAKQRSNSQAKKL